jgi:hypothetical protein
LGDGRRITWALVAAGIVCRLAQYLSDRSFWADESLLVLNIRAKTAQQLLGPLDHHQAAPPLFLVFERLAVHGLGSSEFAFRLLPLACGIAALVLFARLAQRICSPRWGLLAIAVFAFSDRLIWHACEVKPYSGDVFISTALTLLVLVKRRMLWIALLAAVAVWFSYPAVLVYAAVSLALLPAALSSRRTILGWMAMNALVAASFAVVLFLSIRAQHTGALAGYWAEYFLDWHKPLIWPFWLGRRLLALCGYPSPLLGPIVLVGAIAGVAWLVGKNIEQLLALAGPIAMAVLAAAAHRYPFDGGRLTVFLTPQVLLLMAIGFRALATEWWPTRPGRTVTAIAAAGLIIVPTSNAAWHIFRPRTRGHMRPAAQFIVSHARPTDGIYATPWSEFACYWPGKEADIHPEIESADRIPFQRFWIVFSFPNSTARKRWQPLLDWAGTVATQREAKNFDGSAAYLFERTGQETPASLTPPNVKTQHKMMSDFESERPEEQ